MPQTRTVGSQKITTYYDTEAKRKTILKKNESQKELRRRKRSQQMTAGQKVRMAANRVIGNARPVIGDIKTMASGKGNREPWVFAPPTGYFGGLPGEHHEQPRRQKGKRGRSHESEGPDWHEMMEMPASARQWWAY